MIFTLPNYKMKDCQTVKYGCLDYWGEDWLIDLLGELGRVCQTHARGAKNRHGQCIECWEQACQSCWHQEHEVKFTTVPSLPGCKHSPYFPSFTSIFSSLSYYNYKFPLSLSSLFSHEFPSHKTVTIYISSIFLSHIFTTFLYLLLLGQAVSLIQQWIQHVVS